MLKQNDRRYRPSVLRGSRFFTLLFLNFTGINGNYPLRKTVLLIFLLIFPLSFFFADTGTAIFVTATGGSYHLAGCRFLSQSRIEITGADAVRGGYTPCSVCRPPNPEALFTGDLSQNTSPLYRVNIAGIQNSGNANLRAMTPANVVGHVDGDTVRVRISNPPPGLNVVETVRLLGIDTPETVHPNREVEFFGREASEYTRTALLGRNIYLAFDWDLRDRYGRLLAYIYTEEGQCFNARIVLDGYAHAYLTYPFQFMDEFRSLEQEARQLGRGLWGPR